jgi:hypothetical protein
MQGDLIVQYKVRAAGGPVLPAFVRREAARRFDQSFLLDDPDTFFRSYTACRGTIHRMLMETPLLREFDLGADHWDHFMPHSLASTIMEFSRRDRQELGGVALRYEVGMALTIRADLLYDEPKALLLACLHQAEAAGATTTTPAAECCVCMEDLAARDTARLPCSHSFHRQCIVPWFYKAAKCPLCRHDISHCLVALTHTPMGKFPGLQP